MRHDSFEVPLHTLGVPLRTSGLLWQLALHGLLDRCPRNVQLDLELVRCGEVTGRNPSRRQQEAPLVLRGSMAQLSSSLSLIALWFQLLTRLPRELEHSWLEPNPSFLPSFFPGSASSPVPTRETPPYEPEQHTLPHAHKVKGFGSGSAPHKQQTRL